MKLKMFRLYVITNNINGKRYVGYTSKTIQHRFNKHLVAARGKTTNCAVHTAMRKYGEDNFSISLLEECDTFEKTIELEQYYISILETNMFIYPTKGYNMTEGGEGASGFVPTKEQIEASRQKRIGRKWSEEARIAFGKRVSGEKNHRWGKSNSPEHKAALLKAAQEGKTRVLKIWKLFNVKTNEEIIIEDMKKECAERGWNPGSLYSAHYKDCLFQKEWEVSILQ